MIEQRKQTNVKDLAFGDPQPPKRIRPAIDFSKEIAVASELVDSIPHLPANFQNAVCYIDRLKSIFGGEEQNEMYIRTGRDWRAFVTEEFMSQIVDSTAMRLLFYQAAKRARAESREVSGEELKIVSTGLLDLASMRGEFYAKDIQEIAKHPEALVWMAEIVAFQESTLSLPDYSAPEFKRMEAGDMPIMRRF